jgi:hypothetical protein
MRPDPGLVVHERLRAVVLLEGRLIPPLLHDEEMARVIQRLGELIRQAAHLLSRPCLGCAHELPDLLTAGDLHVDVADSDDHLRRPWILATILQAYPGLDEHVWSGTERASKGSLGAVNVRFETAKVEGWRRSQPGVLAR